MAARRFTSASHMLFHASLAWGLATLFALGLAPRPLHAQVCSSDITLTTQAQVDAFNCSEVTGDVMIDGTVVMNLDGLSVLTSVGGDLVITRNPALTNINGLSVLTSVGGSLLIYSNYALNNINGLSGLTSVGGDLDLTANYALTNVDSLSSLTSIGGYLIILGSHALTNVDGLSALTSVGGRLRVYVNAALSRCCGLFPLLNGNGVGGSVDILDNSAGCNSAQDILTRGPCTTAVSETTWANMKQVYRE